MERLHEPRVVRIVAQRGTETLHCRVEAVLEVDERAGRPETLAKLLACHNLARTVEHHRENLERLILQSNPDAALAQFTRAGIDLEVSELDHDRQVKVYQRRSESGAKSVREEPQ